MYDILSSNANSFINDHEVIMSLDEGKLLATDPKAVASILKRAKTFKGLNHREAAVLMQVTDPDVLEKIYALAKHIKEHIYGRRIVIFAPLYLSDYCINNCSYCGYSSKNKNPQRHRLTQEQLKKEVQILEKLGHKRLALETGEDPINCPIDYIIECIQTIYSLKCENGAIRRVNINIAATSIENYYRLKEASIGTYILFQETYHKPTYLNAHPQGPKHNYEWHTEAHDRAMTAGIDDVGVGVLYGLYDWKYDTTAMLMHAEHLEAIHGVGPHTISVPRLRAATGMTQESFPYLVSDDHFKQLVAVLRLAVPYAGMILTTRESPDFRNEMINLGISQVSAGSCTGVGGYASSIKLEKKTDGGTPLVQFEPEDQRSPIEILKGLLKGGYIPSYCTACYREGRTGDRFMQLAKSGRIANVCQVNAILTLQEYIDDYGDHELKELGEIAIQREIDLMSNKKTKGKTVEALSQIKNGARDLRI
ncbi:MAG: [FeFe] hydrogenase H-cluster radical SAM maturase HydG [Holophagales bacterium]|jgi:2-iminoacetate synthase|nr:[FeFe] hydrogenase H-cluster radical SAM maturase HydG [Holophagales bacterium]